MKKSRFSGILSLLGIVLLADLAIFVVIGFSCRWGSACTTDMWSNRLFWAAIAAFVIGMPAVIASLNTGSGIEADPLAAAWAQKAAVSAIQHERRAMGKRGRFFLMMFLIGAGAIGMSALVSSAGAGGFVPQALEPDFSRPERALRAKIATAVDEVMEGYVDYLPLAGATLAVYDGGGPVYVKGYGYADVAAARPADVNTVYEIGAITQQFTAAAILRLAEQGQLDLDDPVTRHLDGLPPALDGVTLHHLLSHTSGLPGDADVAEALAEVLESNPALTPAELVALSERFTPLLFDPGSQYAASEQGYRLLGAVIEAVSGRAYGDYLQAELLDPQGLETTGYCLEPPAGLATGYVVEAGELATVPPYNMSAAYAAGGLCSNAADLVLWQYALAEGRVIEPSSFERMIAETELAGGDAVPHGYGVDAGFSLQGGSYVQSAGKASGFDALLRYYPEADTIVVLLANTTVPQFREKANAGLSYTADRIVRELPME